MKARPTDAPLLSLQLRFVEAKRSPEGIVFRPRFRSARSLLHAGVWWAATCIVASVVVLATAMWLRVAGAVLGAAFAIRALVCMTRFLTTKWLRELKVVWNGAVPKVAGPCDAVPLARVARLGFTTRRGERYFCAVDVQGRTKYLVTVDREHAHDYEAIAAWLLSENLVGS